MRGILSLLFAASLIAQGNRPTVTNARLQSQAFNGDLRRQLTSSSPAWFGYSFLTKRQDHQACCWDDGNGRGCQLEEGKSDRKNVVAKSPIPLEGTDQLAVLFRAGNNALSQLRVVSLECPLDAGGLPFTWIDGVPASASLSFLDNLIHGKGDDHITDSAILSVAQHDAPEADTLLNKLTQPSQSERIREKSIFWLGAARGASGFPILKNLLTADPSEHIRDKTVFALSISKQPEAVSALVEAAKGDPSPHVRSQALFWLAQKAGNHAASTIMNAIQNDPDTHVKEKAVFALSQLPKDEGIPKLIQVATDQRNPQVRKQAFFWLGQSGDPRALAFIEKVLGN